MAKWSSRKTRVWQDVSAHRPFLVFIVHWWCHHMAKYFAIYTRNKNGACAYIKMVSQWNHTHNETLCLLRVLFLWSKHSLYTCIVEIDGTISGGKFHRAAQSQQVAKHSRNMLSRISLPAKTPFYSSGSWLASCSILLSRKKRFRSLFCLSSSLKLGPYKSICVVKDFINQFFFIYFFILHPGWFGLKWFGMSNGFVIPLIWCISGVDNWTCGIFIIKMQ